MAKAFVQSLKFKQMHFRFICSLLIVLKTFVSVPILNFADALQYLRVGRKTYQIIWPT